MIDFFEAAQRLGAAAAIGGALGLNRNVRGKPVGLKTLALVCIGAAAFVMICADMAEPDRADAVSRVMQGVATGIGFVGAGAILRDANTGEIEGLTTATSVWVTAALGCACGLGEWRIALAAVVITTIVLMFGKSFQKLVRRAIGRPDE